MNAQTILQHVAELDANATPGTWQAQGSYSFKHGLSEEYRGYIDTDDYSTGDNEIVSTEVEYNSGSSRGIVKQEDGELIARYRSIAPAMAQALTAVLHIHRSSACETCGETWGESEGDELHDCEHACTECLDQYPCDTASAAMGPLESIADR